MDVLRILRQLILLGDTDMVVFRCGQYPQVSAKKDGDTVAVISIRAERDIVRRTEFTGEDAWQDAAELIVTEMAA